MTTESNRTGQKTGGAKLTARQRRFLPILLASRNHTEACEAGRIGRDTLYRWLKDPAFAAEVDRQRDELAAEGLALLAKNTVKAVEVLVELLDTKDGHLRRLAAVSILGQHTKFRELDELTRRIEAIEERIDAGQRHSAK